MMRDDLHERAMACAKEFWNSPPGAERLEVFIERALTEIHEQATKHALCDCIDRIGGDAYAGMLRTVEELQKQFYDTHCSLEQRELEIEREHCAKVAEDEDHVIEPYEPDGVAYAIRTRKGRL